MVNREILESHPVSVLKKEISATNIKGYSKMKKSEVIDLMLKKEHREKFSHIEKAGPRLSKKEKAEKQKKGDDFALQKADDISMDTIIITPKKRKRKPKAKKRTEIKLTTFKKKSEEKPKQKSDLLNDALDALFKQLKKSYEKNKPKLDKMTATKYKNAVKRQNNKFLTDVKEIFIDVGLFGFMDARQLQRLDKKFYEIVPEEKPKKRKLKVFWDPSDDLK